MRFSIEQHFSAPPDEVIRAYGDPALYDGLHGLAHIGRPDVLSTLQDGNTAVIRLHYRFIADLPSAARRVVDPAKLTWIDETTYDRGLRTSTTRLVPDHYADRFSGMAKSSFEPSGADGATTVRRISGEIKVRVPLVGGRVEEAIVDGLREHLADEAGVVERHLLA